MTIIHRQVLGNLRLMREYKIHDGMKQRCINIKSRDYHYYGGKGVKVIDRWLGNDGFQNFIIDMDWRPSIDYTLDRIDSNGNYEPSNCRWALRWQQQANRMMNKANKSGYIGVIADPEKLGRYISRMGLLINGKTFYINLGRYIDPEQAALEYDKAVIFYKGDYGVTNIL